MYRQRPVKGGRERAQTGLEPMQKKWVLNQMERFGVSEAFVLNTAIAMISGLQVDETYKTVARRRAAAKKKKKAAERK